MMVEVIRFTDEVSGGSGRFDGGAPLVSHFVILIPESIPTTDVLTQAFDEVLQFHSEPELSLLPVSCPHMRC